MIRVKTSDGQIHEFAYSQVNNIPSNGPIQLGATSLQIKDDAGLWIFPLTNVVWINILAPEGDE